MTNADSKPQCTCKITSNWWGGLKATLSTLIFPLIYSFLFLTLLLFDPQSNTTQLSLNIAGALKSSLNFGIFFPVLIAGLITYYIRKKCNTLCSLMQEFQVIASNVTGILIALTFTLAVLDGCDRIPAIESVVYQGLIILAVITFSVAFVLNCHLTQTKETQKTSNKN